MIQKLKLLITISTLVFIISGCIKNEEWYDHQYIFLEHHINTIGTILKGEQTGYLCMDFPMYIFDQSKGIMWSNCDFKMDKSIKLVLGDGESISGSVGSGAGTWLYDIRNYPYIEKPIKISDIQPNGTVCFEYRDSIFVLKSNEQWENKSISIESYVYDGDTISVQQITVTDRLINYGLLEKSGFINGIEF